MSATTGTDTSEAWHQLKVARALLEPELRKAVDRLSDQIRTVAGFHFGWWDEQGRPMDATWGKGVRGALVLASAQAVGGTPDQAVPAAAAVELVHNFSLMHDDLIDGDRTRRGRRTVWSAFGDARAVLTGDALLVAAIDVLAGRFPRQCAPLMLELCDALHQLVAGEGVDLAFEEQTDVTLESCLDMAADKTGSLIAASCALGALTASAEPRRVDGLRAFGRHIGLALQLVDDLLDLWGDSRATGKPVGSDLRSRKKTLPVVAAIRSGTPAGERVAAYYRRATPVEGAEIPHITQLIEQAGGRRWTEQEADRQRAAAIACLTAVDPEPQGASTLSAIADLITHRAC